MTFEEILKSKGWTDEELADKGLKSVLSRLKPVVEETYGEIETHKSAAAKAKEEYDAYKREAEEVWTPAANARITAAEKEAVEARRKAADYAEQLRIARDYGLLPTEEERKAEAPANGASPSPSFDPKAHKLVTYDDVEQFAQREGDAIAMSHDLGAEYEHLTGKKMFEYTGQDGKRGMTALRAEAARTRQDLNTYVAAKFDFSTLRAKKESDRMAQWEAKIRAEASEQARSEMAARMGNPLLRAPSASTRPFLPPAKPSSGQPWEQTDAQRRAGRIERALQRQASQGSAP
jgi:hypothetical protein